MARHPSQIPNLVALYEPYRQASYTGRNHKLVDFSGNGYHGDMGSVKGAMLLGADGLVLPGTNGNYASTARAAITGDLDLRVHLRVVGTPSSAQILLSHFLGTGDQRCWAVRLSSAGSLALLLSFAGSDTVTVTSDVDSAILSGAPIHIRVTRNAASGTVRFYKSSDGDSWAQIGADASAPAGSLYNAVGNWEVGSYWGGFTTFRGTVYSASIRSEVDGAIVANPDFTAAPIGAASFEDDAGNVWTINSSDYDSNDPTITSTGANFDGSDYVILDRPLWGSDFTILTALTATADEGRFYSEGSDTTSTPYFLLATTSLGKFQIYVNSDAGATVIGKSTTGAPFDGTPCTVAVSVNSTTREVRMYVNGVLDRADTHAAGTVSVNISTIGVLRRTTFSSYSTATIHAMAQFDRVLTDGEIAHLHDYYRNQGIVALPAGPIEYTKSPRLMLPQHIGHL